ncbi:MAG: putative amino-acid-binding protein YxeM precursor [Alphaproteobacteria bacterium ADurb.Bin438]|nr:MAG: putative amino-acid-binding protein YxeM precursor [Alphaproteobacteria bacterium ADurb.Bin438]
MKSMVWAFFIAFLGFKANASDIDKLKILADDYAPYSYSENGKVTGLAVDMLDAVLKKSGSTLTGNDIEIVPWANGLKQLGNGPNVVLFTITRTEARENMYKWVGPITASKQVVFAKKGSGVAINSYDDLKKYKIGVVRGELGEDLLEKNGVDKTSIDASSNSSANVKKFNAGRFDLLVGENTVIPYEYKRLGFDPSELEEVFTMSEAHFYYAFSKDVSDEVISSLQSALDELQKDGSVDAIKAKY